MSEKPTVHEAAIILLMADFSQGCRQGGTLCYLPQRTGADGTPSGPDWWVEYGPDKERDRRQLPNEGYNQGARLARMRYLERLPSRYYVQRWMLTDAGSELAQRVYDCLAYANADICATNPTDH